MPSRPRRLPGVLGGKYHGAHGGRRPGYRAVRGSAGAAHAHPGGWHWKAHSLIAWLSAELPRILARHPLLAGRTRVIVPDLRGAGATDAPGGRYDLATMRGDLVALMDALGLERASIVAHDWSALAGFSLCLEHPDRVSRYVAIAVPPPYIRIGPALLWAMVKAMRHLWFPYAVAAPGIGPRLLAGGQQRLATWILRFFEVQPIPDEDVAAYLAVLREPAHARAASALYRQLILPEFIKIMRGSYRGRRLRVPTLVLFVRRTS